MTADGAWREAARLDDLDPEYPALAKIGGRELAICIVEHKPYAVHNICSHAFARLSDGHVEGYEIVCPLHQGSFDVRTGAAVAAPCFEPIGTYETKVQDGAVLVFLPAAKDVP
jgi:nitrite reductase/ring-hydroxylating ferredoxin subunit